MENLTDENYISLICNGEFNAIPDFPIGDLFESFFDNINYNVIKGDEIFVDFTGEAMCDDEPCVVLIRFKVDSSATEFEITEVRVNDEILDEDETLDLLEDIAYVGGAILEDDCDCDDCSEHHCHHDCCGCEDDDEEFDSEDDEDEDDEEDEN